MNQRPSRKKSSSRSSMAIRRGFVASLLALATVAIGARAVHLQVVDNGFFQSRGASIHERVIELPAHRGMIVDRNGEPLAVSSTVASVCADPTKLQRSDANLARLADLLDSSASELAEKLATATRKRRRFVYLQRQIEPPVATKITMLGIDGVWLQPEYRRYYPDKAITANLLGFTDIDDYGRDGLELMFDHALRGKPGQKRVIQDNNRRAVEPITALVPPQAGRKLQLSLDRRLQYLTFRSLAATLDRYRANAATGVVLDVTTGELLAMVNLPSSDPNDYRRRDASLLRNRAVADVFEPGSTLKPFAIAVALEHGLITPATLVNTSPGVIRVGRYPVRDIHNYKTINVTNVIAKSSNVGVTKIAQLLQPQQLWQLYHGVGFGQPSGLMLTGERAGVLRHHSVWSSVSHITQAYGYGLSVTALQLAQAYSVLAADGVRRPLSLFRREEPPAKVQRILSAGVSQRTRAMLEAAVLPGGTGTRAAVPGYRVAGKTGTVHKTDAGRYAEGRYLSLFAGMVPASRPRLVMVVMIDEPQGEEYYGGLVAAPVFAEVMRDALPLLNIPPDDLPVEQLQQIAANDGGTG